MKDSVIIGSGNSRYLKSVADFKTLYPTYDDFAAALVAGTLPIDLNGINPGGFQQVGDSLNKSTLLGDETAALFELPNTAVPDDALKRSLGLVGDFRKTIKNNLDKTWLLCNGETLFIDDYPDLVPKLKSQSFAGSGSNSFSKNEASVGGTSPMLDVIYASGTYYGPSSAGFLYYFKNPRDTFSYIDLREYMPGKYGTIYGIIYQNGYYVVPFITSNYAYVMYTKNVHEGWERKQICSEKINNLGGISYFNGYFVVCGEAYSTGYPMVFYAQSPELEWESKVLYQGNSSLLFIKSINGYLVTGGWDGYVYYTDNIFETWEIMQILGGGKNLYNICFVDNKWILSGHDYNSDDYSGRVWYASTLGGVWSEKIIATDASVSLTSRGFTCFNDELYVAFETGDTKVKLYKASDFDGNWSLVLSTSSSFMVRELKTINHILMLSGGWLPSIYHCIDWDYYAYLPTISESNIYTYIKAKEEI